MNTKKINKSDSAYIKSMASWLKGAKLRLDNKKSNLVFYTKIQKYILNAIDLLSDEYNINKKDYNTWRKDHGLKAVK